MKKFLCLFLVCAGCSDLANRSKVVSSLTNVTDTYSYPILFTNQNSIAEGKIPVPIVTVSWYSGSQLLSNSNFYQVVQYSNNVSAPKYVETTTNYIKAKRTNYYLWEIITNHVSNYSVLQFTYDLRELNLNKKDNQDSLLSNVTSVVPGTLTQSFQNLQVYTNKDNTNKIAEFYSNNLRRSFARRMKFYYNRSSSGQRHFNFTVALPTNQKPYGQGFNIQLTNSLNILYDDPFPNTGVGNNAGGYYYKISKQGLNFEIVNSYKLSNMNNQPYQAFVSYEFLRPVSTNKAYYRMTVSNAGVSANNGTKIVGLIFEATKIFMAGGSSLFPYGTNVDVPASWDFTESSSKGGINFDDRTQFFIGEFY